MERLLIVAAGVLAVALVSRYDSDKQGSVDAPPRAEVGRRATTTDRLTFLLRRRVAIKGSSNPAVNIDKQVPILATGSPEEQLEILKWMRGLSADRVLATMPEVQRARGLNLSQRAAAAVNLREKLIAVLEGDGVEVPDPEPHAVVVEDVEIITPELLPPYLLRDYRPSPHDPAAKELMERSLAAARKARRESSD